MKQSLKIIINLYVCVAESKIVTKGSLRAIEHPSTYPQTQITIYRHVPKRIQLLPQTSVFIIDISITIKGIIT